MASPTIAKIVVLGLGIGVVAASATSVGAQSTTTTTQPATSPIKNDTGKRLCRVVTPTGSRFAQRVCRTPEEWQKSTDDAERHLQESRDAIRDNGCGLQCPQ
jgi:hypothetical protein